MRTTVVPRSEQRRRDELALAAKPPSHYHELISITRTLPSELKQMRVFSNSRLEDVSECPTYGVVHAQKQYPQHARALALEAGEAMHQVFAGLRCWQLEAIQKLPDHAEAAGERVFGEGRWHEIWPKVCKEPTQLNQIGTLAGLVLNTSGYYDDPKDQTRTLSNMETAAMVYAKEVLPHIENWPVWVDDPKAPLKPIGIEQIFDVVLEYKDGKRIRFAGTIDGILRNKQKDNRITMAENKTAARMDIGWIQSFKMRHQITGYMACGMALFGIEMWHARVYGCKIKPTFRGEDVHIEPVWRDKTAIAHWANWVRKNVDTFEQYQDDWEHAERKTHACNRFFRPCSLIPFCSDTKEGRVEQWSQMIEASQSPSERAVAV
jgi:hypothetical protein